MYNTQKRAKAQYPWAFTQLCCKTKDTYTITIYEKVGEYTPTMKEYFYNQMLNYYPDKADYFAYILN